METDNEIETRQKWTFSLNFDKSLNKFPYKTGVNSYAIPLILIKTTFTWPFIFLNNIKGFLSFVRIRALHSFGESKIFIAEIFSASHFFCVC